MVHMYDPVLKFVVEICLILQIVFGEHGVLDGMKEGKALVDMSTVDIGTVTGVEGVSEIFKCLG